MYQREQRREVKNSPKETILPPETEYPPKSIPKQELELKCVIYPAGWTLFGQMQGRAVAFSPHSCHLCSVPGNYWAARSLVGLAHWGSRTTFTLCDENFVNSVQAQAAQPELWASSHCINKLRHNEEDDPGDLVEFGPRVLEDSLAAGKKKKNTKKPVWSTGFYKKVAWGKFAQMS